MKVKTLIKILKTMPENATVMSDDGNGWFAKIRKNDICIASDDNKLVYIGATGDRI